MHAVVLISHFHAFTAFVRGCAHLKAKAAAEGDRQGANGERRVHQEEEKFFQKVDYIVSNLIFRKVD